MLLCRAVKHPHKQHLNPSGSEYFLRLELAGFAAFSHTGLL